MSSYSLQFVRPSSELLAQSFCKDVFHSISNKSAYLLVSNGRYLSRNQLCMEPRSRRAQMARSALPIWEIGALVDPWAPTVNNVDSQNTASQLFAASLFPYLAFLYFITKSKTSPKLTLFGFYFLLAFVGATIPAGIYAKVHYGTSLSNVDWLHGSAESLLTLTNLFIVLGLRNSLREKSNENVTSNVDDKK